jgi:hypothetical protein
MCFGGDEQSYTADARIKPLVAADQPRPVRDPGRIFPRPLTRRNWFPFEHHAGDMLTTA